MSTRSKVLIIDDSKSFREAVCAVLKMADLDVYEYDRVVGAEKQALAIVPDLILLDINFPDGNGFQVCESLRQLDVFSYVPILMITSGEDEETIKNCYLCGATDYISKPVNLVLITERIKYIIKSSKAVRNQYLDDVRQRALLKLMPDIMYRVSKEGIFLDCQGGGSAPTYIPRLDIQGKTVKEILRADLADQLLFYIDKTLDSGQPQMLDIQYEQRGVLNFFETRLVISGPNEVLVIVRDVTQRKQDEEQIRYLAYYDSLTGLPNRMFFHEYLERSLLNMTLEGGHIAILLLDLDRFKRFNDTLGHSYGDLLIKAVADRLMPITRSGLGGGDALCGRCKARLARLGGDEFGILLSGLADVDCAAQMANKIIQLLSKPVTVAGHDMVITPSIGMSVAPDDSDDIDTLLKNADIAMYRAKEMGRNNFQYYQSSMDVSSKERLTIETSLRHAIERNELELYYQPKIDLMENRVIGVECLVRWFHPQRGMISPADFIPIAEETGLIIPIGELIFIKALNQLRQWNDMGLNNIHVAINISGEQFRVPFMERKIAGYIAQAGVNPKDVEIELTETTIMHNVANTLNTLHAIRDMGVSISVDDFGTGYSSLSYLKRFPLNTLKIDQSFVSEIPQDADNVAITKAIIAMAKSLNLNLVAEGVETAQQLSFLSELNCTTIQGFYFSKPLPAEQAYAFMTEPLPNYEALLVQNF